jgi:hypothetical protein
MNTNTLTKSYDALTPEERFRLILAASARGDEAERDRLAHAGPRLALRMSEHVPFAQAFNELATLVYIELLEMAAFYNDANEAAQDALDCPADAQDKEDCPEEESEEDEDDSQDETELAAAPSDCGASKGPAWERLMQVAYSVGYMLRTLADGWKLFCKRLNIPSFLLWKEYPGFDRLQRALALTEKTAFTMEGLLSWLNRIRPAGEPERSEIPFTVEGIAEATEKAFQARAAWWSGD